MEIQGPVGQQDGGSRFTVPALVEGSEDEEKIASIKQEEEECPVYMVLNLGEEEAVAGDNGSPDPARPGSTRELLPGYVTVRLENGVFTLRGRGPDISESQESRPQAQEDNQVSDPPQEDWDPEMSPQGEPASCPPAAPPEGLEHVNLAFRDPVDEQVTGFLVGDIGELQVNLGEALDFGEALDLARKGVLLVFRCPEPGCAKAFDRKQQLKVHLLSHTESQRPFKCTIDNCGWSFTTLYKLKRHLQSHDKQRPFSCNVLGCGKSFTTVYNLKAHLKAHEQENSFRCETCSESFPTSTKLSAHRRTHFEPERPYKCEFPGCDKTFITVTALFSHHRAHVREQEQYVCSFPGCNKQYDKACRLKIHLRTHTGERPFICDFESCGWSFTSMSKLLRHKRKHDNYRRYHCPVEGCGKSFTRAEHLKGHSITHLGTKPFECPVDGCTAKFSARSSLYIHAKKHLQDIDASKTRCLVSSCNKVFTSKQSLKSHMVKQHNISPDLLIQLEATSSLTPSSELTSSGQNDLSNLDLSSLFSVSSNGPGISADLTLVNSGILTIDVSSVGSTLGGNVSVNNNSLMHPVDPLVLVSNNENHPSLESSLLLGASTSILQQSTLQLDDVQTVNAEALGSLASLSMRGSSQDIHGLTSSNHLTIDSSTLTPSVTFASGSSMPELLTPVKVERSSLPGPEVVDQQEGSKVVTQFVFPNHIGTFSSQKEMDYGSPSGSSLLESGGSARTDYRAIQLAKSKKKGGTGSPGSSPTQKKSKSTKPSSTLPSAGGRCNTNVVMPNGGLTLRDPATGTQYVQIQLLQDDPPGDGDLSFQLSSQSPAPHTSLTVDLPVHILQEPHTSTEDDTACDNSQFTGSTINLQDLE
ncbi:zinc finger ZXDC [Pelobates cultripes]|uniref:Zinc finger ZXDC n=1 Tax=Pelobates cultripes TaxID=61616 RepID=A0AAD1SX94_PELCU|nr:zinc finger ZXDC [Pelobates cultripes]